MRRRILIALTALVLAGVSAAALLVYAKGVDRRAVAGREGVWVLLATKRIPAGTTGVQIRTQGLAEKVLMPAETVPKDSLHAYDLGLDKLTLSADLQPDQLLLRGQFSATGPAAAATGGVPDGKIGVSIAVTMAPGVAEKVAAGDQVTVFVTYPRDKPPSEQKTRVLLAQATVISITTGQPADVSPSPSASKKSSGNGDQTYPATLAVDQLDATRLVHAAQTGLIYLGLVGAKTQVTPSAAVDYDSLWP
jgi:pilus assembly protein CpaB